MEKAYNISTFGFTSSRYLDTKKQSWPNTLVSRKKVQQTLLILKKFLTCMSLFQPALLLNFEISKQKPLFIVINFPIFQPAQPYFILHSYYFSRFCQPAFYSNLHHYYGRLKYILYPRKYYYVLTVFSQKWP